MVFTHPLYLLLFLPALAGLIYSFKHVAGMMKNRKRVAFAIRFLLFGSLIFALAGPESHRRNEGLCTIFLLDRSDSITEASRRLQVEFVDKALKGLGPRDVAAVVAFGKDPVMETLVEKLDGIDRIQSTVTSSASDLAAAIRLAGASFPDGKAKRVVLLSDGNETAGDAMEAATVAASDGIPIDHVVLGSAASEREVTVTNVEMPSEVRVDQAFGLKVTVDASEPGSATLLLDRNGVTIKRMTVQLSAGKNTYALSETLTEAGFHRYRVTVQTDRDHDVRNNVGMGFVAVRGRPRALIVQADTKNRELADSLKSQGIDVVLTDAAGLPSRAEDVQIYDTILFNDLNASLVNPRQQKLIQAAVRDTGVGFAMVGGEDSFLPGGWYGTPVAEVLPVDLNIRQRKSFPSTTILIISDTSGSMGMIEDGQPKVRLAAKAAEQTVRMMSSVDKVGVVASTDGIEFVAPVQTLTNKDAVISQIQRLGVGGGGIYCLPSMEFAQDVLMKDNSKVRHLILLADGSDCDQQEGCVAIAAFLQSNKITTTCVSIGEGPHSPFLKTLAAAGGGRYYLATKASQLPAIFTQDAAVMSRSAIEEGTFVPKTMMGEEVLRGIEQGSIPPLFGYCLSDTRPLSRVGMRTHK
ncbi:MAG: VWA domain-containing protein, partial [Fimbriimonadaceae bacterium]